MQTDLDKIAKIKLLLAQAADLVTSVEADVHRKNKQLKLKQSVRLCLGCGEPFSFGPGTGKNAKRKTCSDACKQRLFRDMQR